MIIIACIFGFIACFVAFKLWVFLVREIGSKIISVLKPIYKFLLKIIPVTSRLIVIFIAMILVIFVASLVKGSDSEEKENKVVEEVQNETMEGEEENNQQNESVEKAEREVKEKQEKNFGEKFVDRALRRGEKFTNFLLNAIEANNERLGIGEDDEFKGSTFALLLYTFILFVLLPFILVLVVVLYLIIVMLELFAILLAIDIVILIIRLIRCDNVGETIKYWWQMSWE